MIYKVDCIIYCIVSVGLFCSCFFLCLAFCDTVYIENYRLNGCIVYVGQTLHAGHEFTAWAVCMRMMHAWAACAACAACIACIFAPEKPG